MSHCLRDRTFYRRFASQIDGKLAEVRSGNALDTMHMYVARKNVLENREITLILKGEMSFATETS